MCDFMCKREALATHFRDVISDRDCTDRTAGDANESPIERGRFNLLNVQSEPGRHFL
jgi:hypothetical protein